jgi:hypothetical protein
MGLTGWFGGGDDGLHNPPRPPECNYGWAGRTNGDKICGNDVEGITDFNRNSNNPANDPCPKCTKKTSFVITYGGFCCVCYDCK